MSASSPPTRPLTFQEKVQRKRRNKTPTSSAATSPAETLTPSPTKKSSPHKAQIKIQLAKAMGLPSPTESRSSPTENTPVSPSSRASNNNMKFDHGQDHSSQQADAPLVSTENKIDTQNNNGESDEKDVAPSRPKPKSRRKLPKWPPDPVNEETSEPAIQQEEKPQNRQVEEETVETEPTVTSSEPSSSVGKAPWLRTSPTVSNDGKTGKPSWAKPVANEQTQSEESTPTAESSGKQAAPGARVSAPSPTPADAITSQQKAPGARPRTPSPAPDMNGMNQQKTSWIRPVVDDSPQSEENGPSSETDIAKRVPWVKPRVPSPSSDVVNASTQQEAPWVKSRTPQQAQVTGENKQQNVSERAPSPVPDTANVCSQQKAPWARPPSRSQSPVPQQAVDTSSSQQKAPWIGPPSRDRTPSPVPGAAAYMYSQQKAPWVRPSERERTPSPAPVEETREHRAEREVAAEIRPIETVDEMNVDTVSAQKEVVVSKPPSPSRKQRVKKWPPVRTEPFPNGYKQQQQQQAARQMEDLPPTRASETPTEEPPSEPSDVDATYSQRAAALNEDTVTSTSSPSDEAHPAVRKAPWLRTSPASPSKGDGYRGHTSRIRPDPPDEVEAPVSLAEQQRKAWGRRSPSPVPTGQGGSRGSSLTESNVAPKLQAPPGRVSAAEPSSDSAGEKQSANRTYRKPPTPPQYGASKYVPPWVKAAESKKSQQKDGPDGPRPQAAPLHDDLDPSPSDEIMSPPLVNSPPPSSSSKILSEVKTRQVSSNAIWEDSRGNPRSEEVEEAVVSYGGAVIEKPKSVNVASMASSFAAGERFSPPKKSWNGQTKQSTYPGDPTPDQPARSPWRGKDYGPEVSAGADVRSPEQSQKKSGSRWGLVHSPPPMWSKESRSSTGQQRASRPPMSTKPPVPSQKQTPVRSPPPSWVNRGASPGDLSSIRTPQWSSRQPQPQTTSLDRTPPPAWVNHDASQGDLSSIRTPDWDSRPEPTNGTVQSSRPPSWINKDPPEDELSPMESPQHVASQRKVRITVETVDDESANDEGTEDRWSPQSQTDEYVYAAREEETVDNKVVANDEEAPDYYYARKQHAFDDSDELPAAFPQQMPLKSPSKSLAQMAMDSVFALDFDLALSQTAKTVLSPDDDESSASSPSKDMARSLPPERELPDEVKALLERSLNRTMSDSRLPDDSEAYEGDYFSDTSAVDETGSTWNENDISALSDGSALAPLSPSGRDINHSPQRANSARWSPTKKDASNSSSSHQARRALDFSADEPPARAESKNELLEAALRRVQALKLNDDTNDESESELAGLYDVTGATSEDHTPKAMNSAAVLDKWGGGRSTPAPKREEQISSRDKDESVNETNEEATMDFSNCTDLSIQVSPDSPRQTSLVGTSPALLSDSPPEDFAGRKTVRFGDEPVESHGIPSVENTKNQAPSDSSSQRRVTENQRHDDDTKQQHQQQPPSAAAPSHNRTVPREDRQQDKRDMEVKPPVDEGSSPSLAGANRVLQYFSHEANLMDSTEDWIQRDPDLDDLMSEPTEADVSHKPSSNYHVDWRHRKTRAPPRSSDFPTTAQHPFSKHDDRDSFFEQDDPFAASKSGSADFASDFGSGFNPFAEEEPDDTFDFEKQEAAVAATEFFSPYGDAPKTIRTRGDSSSKGTSNATRGTMLSPSKRDKRRRREASAERYDEYYAKQATTFAPSTLSVDDYEEYYAQQATYTPSASTDISPKDGTYLLEI